MLYSLEEKENVSNLIKLKIIFPAFFIGLMTTLSSPTFASNEVMLDLLKLLHDKGTLSQDEYELLASAATIEDQIIETSSLTSTQSNNNTVYIKREDAGWTENIKISGDLRYRHNMINEDNKDSRQRQRVRARIGLDARVNDNVKVGIRLASGGDDPVSTNQDLTDGGSTKGINLDRAYFDWRATANTHVIGGKMKNPFYRPGSDATIWDDDYNPEGMAVTYSDEMFFVNAAGFWMEENKNASSSLRNDDDDSYMLGAQAGLSTELANMTRLTAGVSYYDYMNTQGQTPFYDGSRAGNSLDVNGGYLTDFNIIEVFANAGFMVGEFPLMVYADYINNTAADDLDTAWAIGAKIGSVSAAGSWDLGLAYRNIEADAVVGTFPDSDFGDGGTDAEGFRFTGGYGFAKNWSLRVNYYLNDIDANAGNEHDYGRLQADLQYKF
jgi:hypothetical protein